MRVSRSLHCSSTDPEAVFFITKPCLHAEKVSVVSGLSQEDALGFYIQDDPDLRNEVQDTIAADKQATPRFYIVIMDLCSKE